MELVNGRPRFSWGGSRSEPSRVTIDRDVSTGRWYKLTATRHHQVGTLSLEDCTESGEYCKTCEPDDLNCFRKVSGQAGTLSFHGNPLHFGGLPSAAEFLSQFDQIKSDDFVGCVKSLSLDGQERNILTDPAVANRTGVTDTCNQVEGGACSRGDECGASGSCVPLWDRQQCRCGAGAVGAPVADLDVISPDCGRSLTPVSLTEEQNVVFSPTPRYTRSSSLVRASAASIVGSTAQDLWDGGDNVPVPSKTISLSFRTLVTSSTLLTVRQLGGSAKTVVEVVDGVLHYFSTADQRPSSPDVGQQQQQQQRSAINMTSGVLVSDGQWHGFGLEASGQVIRLWVDGSPAGYELELSATHDFLDPEVSEVVLGETGEARREEGGKSIVRSIALFPVFWLFL